MDKITATDAPEERIVLLDNDGVVMGSAPKLASHHKATPLHLAFSCYVFNDKGEFLVTQRAHDKKVWPGVWTNSFCGHPLPGEPLEQAVQRRAADELGIVVDDIVCIAKDYRYKTPPYNGIIENEVCPIFVARLTNATKIAPNPREVASHTWVPWAQYVAMLQRSPDDYSYWAKDQYAYGIESAVLGYISGVPQ